MAEDRQCRQDQARRRRRAVQVQEAVKEAYLPEADVEKNVWILKATPAVLEKIYKGKDMEFRDATGQVGLDEQKGRSLRRVFRQVSPPGMRLQVANA